jgi:hypothetical protein
MELDDLRREWMHRDKRLEQLLSISARALQEHNVARFEEEFERRSRTGIVYWVSFVLTMTLLGTFLADEAGEVRFCAPALLLLIWVVAVHVSTLLDRDALRRLNFAAPVVELQLELEKLRQRRLRAFKWTLLTGQIVWCVPFMIVLFRGLFGIDLYLVSDAIRGVMFTSVLGGLAFIPVAIWASAKCVAQFKESPRFQRILDSLAGRDIQHSLAFVRRLEEFREGTGPGAAPGI